MPSLRRRAAPVLLPLLLAAGLAVSPAGAAFAGDPYITTDPLAAATMPKPGLAAVYLFRPSFMMPLARVFSFEQPLEMQPIDRFPAPGLAPRTPKRPENVLLTVPPDNSIFVRNSIVTFGWLPAEQEIGEGDAPNKVQFPIRYEIYIVRHDTWSARLYVKADDTRRAYTHMYSLPPGRYTWHVRAVYNTQMHGFNSDQRTFMVLP